MGKYIKKSKLSGEAGAMDATRSSGGVRTRAKTLASRRLQSSAAYTPSKSDLGYLELRSRRLVRRPPLLRECMQSTRMVSFASKNGFAGGENGDQGIEVSFGGNDPESEDRDRSDGESTRCSFIKVAESSSIPGSTMKQTSVAPAASQSAQNARFGHMPTTDEIEEFLACEEQSWQRHFIEKYNFDIVNDLPLPGRYEWVKKSS